MKRNFNYIYNELVKNENDTIGLIAYGLYKRKKINFIISFNEKNRRDITEEELSHFHLSSVEHVDVYRTQAEVLSYGFAEEYSNEESMAIEEEYNQKLANSTLKIETDYNAKLSKIETDYKNELSSFKTELSNTKTKFWEGVSQSLVGSVMMIAVLGLCGLLIMGWRFNFWESIEILAKTVNQAEQALPPSKNTSQPNNLPQNNNNGQ